MVPSATGILSVVVPAHDEERVLPALLAAIDDDGLELVVVPNGCTDRTADAARAASPRARVVEVHEASKTAALRAGDATAHHFPRSYLDADVAVTAAGLRQLADALAAPGVLAVAPTVVVDSSGASWPVRAFYRALPLLPSVSTSIAGTGCIVLSEEGRARFGDWPAVLADDYFLDGLFRPDEKRRVAGVTSRVRTPRRLGDLVRRRVRVTFGNRQVDGLGLRIAPPVGGGVLAAVRRHPGRALDLAVFVAVGLVVRLRVAAAIRGGREVGWNRDDSRDAA